MLQVILPYERQHPMLPQDTRVRPGLLEVDTILVPGALIE
jgi:hypothetical protein